VESIPCRPLQPRNLPPTVVVTEEETAAEIFSSDFVSVLNLPRTPYVETWTPGVVAVDDGALESSLKEWTVKASKTMLYILDFVELSDIRGIQPFK
jgi:hypothetical protein